MRTRIITVALIALVGVVVVTLWWIKLSTNESRQHVESTVLNRTSSNPSPASVAQKPAQEGEIHTQFADHKMSDLEYLRLKVELPAPVNEPWKGPLFDSNNCFDPKKKQAAVEVLPTWIRQAMLAGKPEIAARYLWTLIKLSEDEEPAVATKGAFAIYRLGDYSGTALGKMKDWIESGVDFRYSDSISNSGASKDIRAQVLDELELSNDNRLDQSIYDTWLRNRNAEGKDLSAVDYAYYLEKHGRELPVDYWLKRLDNPYGFKHAMEIAEQKTAPGMITKLQSIFKKLKGRPTTTPDAGRAACVAASLYRQTKDNSYRNYLIEQARAPLASGSFESSLAEVMEGLAATHDRAALEVVSTAMQHKNTVIQEMAIDALGKSHDPAATELLFEAAIQKAKQGKGFPARELHALLVQGNPKADSKYVWLQQALLGGQLGWSATTSDFDALEFFRKYGRN